MESLIRGGASRAENLFRSPSKENLVRSSSRDSLTPLGENESLGTPTYDPPSDIESEAEEPPGSAESLSKEQLLHRMLRVERSLGKYRGKYSEVRVTKRVFSYDYRNKMIYGDNLHYGEEPHPMKAWTHPENKLLMIILKCGNILDSVVLVKLRKAYHSSKTCVTSKTSLRVAVKMIL